MLSVSIKKNARLKRMEIRPKILHVLFSRVLLFSLHMWIVELSLICGDVYTKSSNSCFLSGSSSGTCCCLREYLHYMLLFQGIDTDKCYVCRKFSLQNNIVSGKFLLHMSLFPIYSLEHAVIFMKCFG
jgi:hypothetical protein